MKTCPYCAESIQDQAIKCRYCGEDLSLQPSRVFGGMLFSPGLWWGYEFRSTTEIFGWPLLHVAYGINPQTGLPRLAKGIIAVGNFAVGMVAIGGFAAGGLVIGGIGLGLITLAGIAIGAAAAGGLAVGLFAAVGGLAISKVFAIGGLALAPHTIGSVP